MDYACRNIMNCHFQTEHNKDETRRHRDTEIFNYIFNHECHELLTTNDTSSVALRKSYILQNRQKIWTVRVLCDTLFVQFVFIIMNYTKSGCL